MKIKVLGPGCKNCEALHKATIAAVEELGMSDAYVEYVKDISEISKYIMATPGLVVDEVVVHEGKPLPTAGKINKILQKAKG
ncbi:redox-active disulfide protein 2 [Flexistipes sinusarabici DSM 4947]|uniref:Redox-active disulfide protein 2 n=1 Tax=Flexistipes sinusarabici (strain ATCC 49648 / DSM 4947 / MAS 10) TaxID=717231 RepID=F8E6C1_FLESM|nr:thioredoxin family protein [Flexistipes sinusarabici]AEI15888.1 redox-active disulfide protein 2 [Flexistipes sinusarabici DSM 4947]